MEDVKSRYITEGPEHDELMAGFAEAKRRHQNWSQVAAELKKKYPRMFVALQGCEVVAASKDLFEMDRLLAALGLRSPQDVDVRFVRDGTEIYIL